MKRCERSEGVVGVPHSFRAAAACRSANVEHERVGYAVSLAGAY